MRFPKVDVDPDVFLTTGNNHHSAATAASLDPACICPSASWARPSARSSPGCGVAAHGGRPAPVLEESDAAVRGQPCTAAHLDAWTPWPPSHGRRAGPRARLSERTFEPPVPRRDRHHPARFCPPAGAHALHFWRIPTLASRDSPSNAGSAARAAAAPLPPRRGLPPSHRLNRARSPVTHPKPPAPDQPLPPSPNCRPTPPASRGSWHTRYSRPSNTVRFRTVCSERRLSVLEPRLAGMWSGAVVRGCLEPGNRGRVAILLAAVASAPGRTCMLQGSPAAAQRTRTRPVVVSPPRNPSPRPASPLARLRPTRAATNRAPAAGRSLCRDLPRPSLGLTIPIPRGNAPTLPAPPAQHQGPAVTAIRWVCGRARRTPAEWMLGGQPGQLRLCLRLAPPYSSGHSRAVFHHQPRQLTRLRQRVQVRPRIPRSAPRSSSRSDSLPSATPLAEISPQRHQLCSGDAHRSPSAAILRRIRWLRPVSDTLPAHSHRSTPCAVMRRTARQCGEVCMDVGENMRNAPRRSLKSPVRTRAMAMRGTAWGRAHDHTPWTAARR